MSTLIEIESAVSSLPPTQQRTLLMWLQSLVEAGAQTALHRQTRHEAWLQKLSERRKRGVTGTTGTPLQQIMDDLRGVFSDIQALSGQCALALGEGGLGEETSR
ncbi:MAG: hypothetical protein JWR15_1891 [Prosthecobacter sp.]|nr:hypothetical protein [Prosthecobacter sp.]